MQSRSNGYTLKGYSRLNIDLREIKYNFAHFLSVYTIRNHTELIKSRQYIDLINAEHLKKSIQNNNRLHIPATIARIFFNRTNYYSLNITMQILTIKMSSHDYPVYIGHNLLDEK